MIKMDKKCYARKWTRAVNIKSFSGFAAGLRHRLVGPGPLTSKSEAFSRHNKLFPIYGNERMAERITGEMSNSF